MNVKKICLILVIAALFVGCAYASSDIGDFKISEEYDSAYNSTHYCVYLNGKNEGGITIYKNTTCEGHDDSNLYENFVHDDWQDYLTGDDNITIAKNGDDTVNFTDHDHSEHGISEIIKKGDKGYIIVFWAKDGTDIDNSKLMSELQKFNKDNDVEPVGH